MKIIEENKIKALLSIAKDKDNYMFDCIYLDKDRMIATDSKIVLQTVYSQQNVKDYPEIDGMTQSDVEFDSDAVSLSFFEKIIKNTVKKSTASILNNTAIIQKTDDEKIEVGITDLENNVVLKTKLHDKACPDIDKIEKLCENACNVTFTVSVLEKLIKAAKAHGETHIEFNLSGNNKCVHRFNFETQQANGFLMSCKPKKEK